MDDYDDYVMDAEDYSEVDDDWDEDYDDDDDDDMDSEDEMLDAMIESAEDDDPDELADFFWRNKKKRGKRRRKSVLRAKGRNTFRRRSKGGYVTQVQLKSALGRVANDVRRNAIGIKTVNKRINGVSSRVSANSRVNRIQSMQIGKLHRTNKVDGVLEFVQAYDPVNGNLDAFQLLKGAVKSGLIGTGKGGMHNPYLIGGLGLLLRNPNALGGLLGQSGVNSR